MTAHHTTDLPTPMPHGVVRGHVVQAVGALRARLAEPWTLDASAEEVHLSRSQCRRQVKADHGVRDRHLVDRTGRYLKLVHLPGDHSAGTVRDALVASFGALPADVRLTLTWDQGSELAHHGEIAALFRQGVFFAHPGKPWQRGTNENTNGLARQHLPKCSDLSIHTPADLAAIEQRLNTRPRKRLEWRTPVEIFETALAS
jgi:hypothetical protein